MLYQLSSGHGGMGFTPASEYQTSYIFPKLLLLFVVHNDGAHTLSRSPVYSRGRQHSALPLCNADMRWLYRWRHAHCTFLFRYATRQLYAYCPSWALDWDYRKQQILKEISQRDADLIMLQEVETREFYGYFQPELHQRGYEGVFRAKSRARNMGDQDRKSVDGCAIFFKCSKFEMMHDYLIEFERLATQIGSGAPDILNRVMPKDNIACGVVRVTLTTIPPSA